jgi:hypothetical protein
MLATSTLDATDELEFGKWISLKNVQTIPLSVDRFWSAFDDYSSLLMAFSGRTDVELETGDGKPKDGPGAIVRFNFEGSIVRDRLLINDRQNHLWKMDIPEATALFTLYQVTITAREVGDRAEVSITVDFVLSSEKREERAEALKTLKEFLPKRIPEIVKFVQQKDGIDGNSTPITESEIRQLAADFYVKLDAHAPVAEYTPLFAFAQEDLKIQFPSLSVQNWEGFKQWYEGSINLFFDEVHALKEIKVTASDDRADVQAIVHWEASMWKPPAAHSQRIVMDAHHTWVVKRSPDTHKPMFKNYIVQKFDFAEGSAKPEVPAVDAI